MENTVVNNRELHLSLSEQDVYNLFEFFHDPIDYNDSTIRTELYYVFRDFLDQNYISNKDLFVPSHINPIMLGE